MFLLRSAFWLTVAFVVIRPGVDINSTAGALSAQAMAAGQQFVTEQILATDCTSLQCAGGKAVITAAFTSTPSFETPMQDSSISPVPFPRPRPDWMG